MRTGFCCSRIHIFTCVLPGTAAVGPFPVGFVEDLLLLRAEFCKRATSVNKFTNSAVAFKLFSLSLGQLISDRVTEIVEKYDSKVYSTKYDDQLATRPASAAFDDSYLGTW